jgi:hypothetical protein
MAKDDDTKTTDDEDPGPIKLSIKIKKVAEKIRLNPLV